MKALARSYIWWPKMDQGIKDVVRKCWVHQESRASASPLSAPLHPWQWPIEPWSRIHLDFAGPYMGHTYLIIVDACSKWVDAHIMSSISSEITIHVLRSVFCYWWTTTDNSDWKRFLIHQWWVQKFHQEKWNQTYHINSIPMAKLSSVQTIKQGLKQTPGKTIQEKLSKFLFKYRIIPT